MASAFERALSRLSMPQRVQFRELLQAVEDVGEAIERSLPADSEVSRLWGDAMVPILTELEVESG